MAIQKGFGTGPRKPTRPPGRIHEGTGTIAASKALKSQRPRVPGTRTPAAPQSDVPASAGQPGVEPQRGGGGWLARPGRRTSTSA